MSSSETSAKAIPQITREDLDHISPLHRYCAEQLIDAGWLVLIDDKPQSEG